MADSELRRNCQLHQQQLLSQGTSFPFHTEQNCEQNFDGPSCNESRSASPATQVGLEVGGQQGLGLLEHGLAAARTICQPCDDGDLIELIRERRCIWDTSCRSFKETPKKQQAWREIAAKLGQDGMWRGEIILCYTYLLCLLTVPVVEQMKSI